MKTAIEVGVADGYFARQLLQSKSLEHLWLVDTWDNSDHWQAVRNLAQSDSRVHLYQSTSAHASKTLTADFIYLDACHEYEHIRQDIDLWWPKAQMCLAGHDYAMYNSIFGTHNGVVLAVEETFGIAGVRVTGAGEGRIERLRAAYWATVKKDYGPWAEDVPSWYVMRDK